MAGSLHITSTPQLLAALCGNQRVRLSPVYTIDAQPLRSARRIFERQFIGMMLRLSHGNIADAARHLGLDRGHLHRKLTSLGIITSKRKPP